jgi:hypothetical protein
VLPTHHGPAEHDRANSSQDESGLTERVYNARQSSGQKRLHAQPASFRGTMATGVIRQGNHRFENLFFSGMAVLILGAVFLGFARSYYLAGVFKAPLPNLIVHIHGAVFSSWILLLIAQTSLVAAGRIDLHRRLN